MGDRIRKGMVDRENARHYIPATESEILEMLDELEVATLDDLFEHIDEEFLFKDLPRVDEERGKETLRATLTAISNQNTLGLSLLGDGLADFSVSPIVRDVLRVRNLSTSYTPYQPERSQGTLISQWIYQCSMAALTGFEAINASLYDRSTAIFEGCLTSFRVARSRKKVAIYEGIFPGDREVIETHFHGTENEVLWLPMDSAIGLADEQAWNGILSDNSGELSAVVIPQVNSLGFVEDFDSLTRLCESLDLRVVAVIDPVHLAPGGLQPPSEWGENGADFMVGEAQHLALNPCFGGPGLGIFGVRTDGKRKNHVRHTPGRYVGKAVDKTGRDCFVAVMSAREQHIRRDRATSNICSNQAFIASLAGAALLELGDEGLRSKLQKARDNAAHGVDLFLQYEEFELFCPNNVFLNEVTFTVKGDTQGLIGMAAGFGIELGHDVSDRVGNGSNLLKVAFSDRDLDFTVLEGFLSEHFERRESVDPQPTAEIPEKLKRVVAPGVRRFSGADLNSFYERLGQLNVSPDNAIFPLGSCTMKYNPEMNEWAAALEGFQFIHPQSQLENSQGCLQVLHETQEWFQAVTGLAGVTTQPVAGAQGELVGIKMFQAYHEQNGENHRDVVMIPDTAHGTNFATAVMAGYTSGRMGRSDAGVVVLKTDPLGGIDLEDFDQKLAAYRDRLVGIMITNPNTCGVFESNFRRIADDVHGAGGLVYMDGANMNAIAGRANLAALGVDAVHNNIHKTWSIPHGGGGPGDGFVAVSEVLIDYLPGLQVRHSEGNYETFSPPKSIGSFHRHWGNFNHKIRCLAYLYALGREGIPRMSGVAVLAARYVYKKLLRYFVEIPVNSAGTSRMHEGVLTLKPELWEKIEAEGISKTAVMPGLGKLYLDFGYHAPTIAFPEALGMMVEPTECYTKDELDRFIEVSGVIIGLIEENPHCLIQAPFFTPIDRINEVEANRSPILSEPILELVPLHENRIHPLELLDKPSEELADLIRSKWEN